MARYSVRDVARVMRARCSQNCSSLHVLSPCREDSDALLSNNDALNDGWRGRGLSADVDCVTKSKTALKAESSSKVSIDQSHRQSVVSLLSFGSRC